MSSVQIDQKSYEMPPKEGMSIAHFLTVGDINRSLDYYEKVFAFRLTQNFSSFDDQRTSCHPL